MGEMKHIAAALAKAQSEMSKAIKGASNPHLRSKYADLASVMDACMGPLNINGIAVIQPAGEDEIGRHVKTILIHGESGESLECTVPLIVQKTDMQGYGSAVTYARRYGLMAMAGIAPEDDDGNAASKAPPKQRQQQERRTQEQKQPQATDNEVNAAIDAINAVESLPDLADHWNALNKDVRHVAADQRVIDAKNVRKTELENK